MPSGEDGTAVIWTVITDAEVKTLAGTAAEVPPGEEETTVIWAAITDAE